MKMGYNKQHAIEWAGATNETDSGPQGDVSGLCVYLFVYLFEMILPKGTC